jgi:hypothetical protein
MNITEKKTTKPVIVIGFFFPVIFILVVEDPRILNWGAWVGPLLEISGIKARFGFPGIRGPMNSNSPLFHFPGITGLVVPVLVLADRKNIKMDVIR